MENRKRKWMSLVLAAILLSTALITYDPRIEAEKFVGRWGSRIEESLAAGQGVPDGAGEYWSDAKMIEFTLTAKGLVTSSSYYGCYYSFEDVPLASANAHAELVPAGENVWQWQGEGDNHGLTEKIRDHWYYFEAHF